MEKADLWIRNAKVYNSYRKEFFEADVSVKDGKFFYIDREKSTEFDAVKEIDADGKYMIPGMIDIHMHIESSMMTPGPFGRYMASCGVTTIVSEPHEMANVRGIRGVHEMICAAEEAPIDIYYGIPSSVPSTSSRLETTGGVIDCEAMKCLLKEKDVVCVGEIMNYRKIIEEGNQLEITKFLEYLREEKPGYVVEGHCPSLTGLELAKFLYLGIDGDHTEHTLEEVRQRIENGMFFEIQEKMLKPEILDYIVSNNLYEHVSFVTDDTMADALYEKGHLNKVAEQAVRMGFPVEQAIYCATFTPARRMQFYDRGSIAPGKLADFQLLENLEVMEPSLVYKCGVEIYHRNSAEEPKSSYEFPEDFYHSVCLPEITKNNFQIPANGKKALVRAICVQESCTQTKEVQIEMPVKDGYLHWQESGCMLAMVIERYGKNGNIGYGFLTGDCCRAGTVATTYYHDHHNLLVAGHKPEDMLLAVQRLEKLQGGFLVVNEGEILAELALPVCGILNEGSVENIGRAVKKIRGKMNSLGYKHLNPIMSFGTLGLPVSPALKLTDRGLIDVKAGEIVPLFVK
ncbi:adenine deaminase C-terminal domain-containing protein [Faecalicatena orotica]|uniref:Adenine deaminase n=1 Tax=Faecalicatena orotica TaxID=1544 RepID=A0A2Y9BP26_9FIRM|nr:adenine deaminase C-terminal domain-containing protein [Faecalicatena orotica]PWJ20618.1 adenine deaminase [Faecalicatena orotica]SSA58557.1 adenine deaminase [Faecalicatena orotica]